MTHDVDDVTPGSPGDGDELDRLRLALLHERSRAEVAERELAELRATIERAAADEASPAPEASPAARRARLLRRRR